MGLVSMVRSHPRQNLGNISPLFSGYTISLPGRVSREQWGCATEILSRLGHREELPEPTAKQYYDMLSVAQKPLHGHTNVSQFDAIARILALKSECGISRDGFDKMLTVFW